MAAVVDAVRRFAAAQTVAFRQVVNDGERYVTTR
jgi:hypothetical protein